MTNKISLTNLVNLQNETTAVSAINANNAAVVSAMNNTLSRDGTAPNQMGAALDMNSNQIYNLPAPSTVNSPARLIDVTSNPTIVIPGTGTSGHVVPYLDGNNTWAGSQYFKSGSPWYDVKAYGAVGDGSTDDTTSIQNAINAAQANGRGQVFFPSGTYKVSSTLNVTGSNISLVGSGTPLSTTIQGTVLGQRMLYALNALQFNVECLGFIGATGVHAGTSLVRIESCQGSRFVNNEIANAYIGLELISSTNSLIMFNKIVNIYGTSYINITTNGGDYIISNQLDTSYQGVAVTPTSGFGAWTTSHVYAANSVVIANGGYFGTIAGGTSSNSGTGPVITALGTPILDGTVTWYFLANSNLNVIDSNSGAGQNWILYNDITGPCSNCILLTNGDGHVVQGNQGGSAVNAAVRLATGITNCFIMDNFFSSLGGYGIVDAVGSGNKITIQNNNINNCGLGCIYLSSPYSKICDNILQGPGAATASSAGITVAANVSNFIIATNIVVGGSGSTGGGAPGVQVFAGTSNHYNIVNNIIGTFASSVSDGGSGVNKTITGNN